jgi:hypothetical protein
VAFPSGVMANRAVACSLMRLYAKRVTVFAAVLFVFPVHFGCKRSSDSAKKPDAAAKSEPVSIAPIVDTLRDAPALTLREGLPHQFFESDALKNELSQKRTVQLREFPFYEEALTLKPEDALALTAFLASGEALVPEPPLPPNVTVHKMCGGFHPDYAIQWTVRGRRYDVLVCFGCGEARCYGPDRQINCDVSKAARAKLSSMLTPYGRNRPVTTIPE